MTRFALAVVVVFVCGACLVEAADVCPSAAKAGGVMQGDLGPQAPPVGRQYVIDTRLTTRDAAGREATLAAPRVITVENRLASIRVGSQTPRPGKTREIEWLNEGIAIELKVFADDEGKRFLDVDAQCTERQTRRPNTLGALVLSCLPCDWLKAGHGDAAGVRLATRAVRIVEPLRIDEKTTAALDTRTQVEIRVREAAKQDAIAKD